MFQPNQKVICIRDENCKPMLRNGSVFTVAHHFNAGEMLDKNGNNGGGIMLLNHVNPRTGVIIRPPCFWAANRFRAATDAEIATASGRVSPASNAGSVELPVAPRQETPVAATPAVSINVELEEASAMQEKINDLTEGLSELRRDLRNHIENDDCHNN